MQQYPEMDSQAGAVQRKRTCARQIAPELGSSQNRRSQEVWPEGLADSFFDLVFDGSVRQDYVSAWNAQYENLFGPSIASAKARFAQPPVPPSPALADAAYLGNGILHFSLYTLEKIR